MRRWVMSATSVAAATLLSGCVVVSESPAPTQPEQSQGSDEGTGSAGTGGGDGYAFVRTRGDGEPVRWSTCEPIRYVVRPDREPDGARDLLEESLQRITDATGLEFEATGTTDEAPARQRGLYQPDRYGDRWAPVLVAYSTPDEDSRLSGAAAGYGGPALVRVGTGTPRYVSGTVVFDVDEMTSMGGQDAMQAVMLHELGHLVGLAHVDDRGQLMNPTLYGRETTDLQEGDLAGLEILGDGECYEPIKPRPIRDSG